MTLPACETQTSQSTIRRLLQPASRAKILEMEAAGIDLACLTKSKIRKHLTLAEKLEIIRLHDENNPGITAKRRRN